MDAVIRYENKFFNNKLDLNILAGASQEMRRDRSFSAQNMTGSTLLWMS